MVQYIKLKNKKLFRENKIIFRKKGPEGPKHSASENRDKPLETGSAFNSEVADETAAELLKNPVYDLALEIAKNKGFDENFFENEKDSNKAIKLLDLAEKIHYIFSGDLKIVKNPDPGRIYPEYSLSSKVYIWRNITREDIVFEKNGEKFILTDVKDFLEKINDEDFSGEEQDQEIQKHDPEKKDQVASNEQVNDPISKMYEKEKYQGENGNMKFLKDAEELTDAYKKKYGFEEIVKERDKILDIPRGIKRSEYMRKNYDENFNKMMEIIHDLSKEIPELNDLYPVLMDAKKMADMNGIRVNEIASLKMAIFKEVYGKGLLDIIHDLGWKAVETKNVKLKAAVNLILGLLIIT